MESYDIQSKPKGQKTADYFLSLPNEVLVKIFSYLEIHDVMYLSLVCKRWNSVSSADSLWEKFVPKYPGINLPKAKTQKNIFRKLWSDGVQIGKERWLPNPLPDLVEYNISLEKHNKENIPKESDEIFSLSKCMLYLRLNPLYHFTTDEVKHDDPLMGKIVHTLCDKLGHICKPGDEEPDVPVPDTTSLMGIVFFGDKKFAMWLIAYCCYDSRTSEHCFLKRNEKLIDEEGRIIGPGVGDAFLVPGGMCLSKSLFDQIRNIVVGTNDRFIIYNVALSYRNEQFDELPYARQILVSDTAVVLCAGRRFATS
ncbi:uncharacterized protein LOC114535636 [Dendronephthya gigantea]|uniref:uncharacterized protein LOC114535636 n=1 Tax=Dendronephthya gigantea TaxID=151771 RepID=UPI001069C612|nr:uncharacterized protein LOC114535636 [Dendronephthya gigantea]